MKSNIRFFVFVFVCLMACAVIARGQEVQVTGSHERVQTRVFAPVSSRVSLGAQYGFENGRAGKHDAAALVRVDVLRVGRLTVSPEAGFGFTRTRELDLTPRYSTILVPVPLVGLMQVPYVYDIHVSQRTPMQGTGIFGASASYKLTEQFSLTGGYQRHAINNTPDRNVWTIGGSWTF